MCPVFRRRCPPSQELRGISTWCKVQLRLLSTHRAVTVATVLQTFGLPEIWACHSEADVDYSVPGWLRVDGLKSTNLSGKLTAVQCYISNSTKQQMYLKCIHAAVLSRYCRLVNRLQLTFGVSRNNGREGKNRSCQTRVSVTAWPTFHWSPFVWCFICNKPDGKFMHVEY